MPGGLRRWLAAWGGYTALALFFAVSASLTYRSTGRAANWTLSIERSLIDWWLWALFTPAIVWLARRFPLDRSQIVRHLAALVAAGFVIAVAKTVAERAVFAWVTGMWMYWLVSTLALQFAIYGAIVAAAHTVMYYERSRERDQLEARLADARLQLLGMQLQPHFLFNTLNTIAELVHDDADTADRMITGLSDLLRRTLELGPTQEIALDAELALLEQYLDIQRARFGERLRITFTISDDSRRASVPVLLLQPLVENAIRHGLGERLSAGHITIAAQRNAGRLVVTVSDDGLGPAVNTPHTRERVGLGNTRARLEALYGSNQRLDLSTAASQGACVTLEIPFKLATVSTVV
jgi:two-component system LytT family sensor kinase